MWAARTALSISLAACLSAGISAVPRQQGGAQPDERVQAQVERQLDKKDLRGITVVVKDGAVTLSGMVSHLYAKNQAEDLAKKVTGVTSVVNQLTIDRIENDAVVAEMAAAAVRRYSRYSVFDDIQILVKNGAVLVGGAVTTPMKAKEIADLVTRVAGVQAVKNAITVLPVSGSDDQIRNALATMIYNDAMFEQYASMAVPPIHIIVANGRVVLTGAVASTMERQKAEMIARSVFGVFDVQNRLQVQK